MRVLHVSTSDIRGGAARAATRLHRALCDAGVDSRMLVRDRSGDDPRTFAPPSRLAHAAARAGAVVDRVVPYAHPHRTGAYFTAALVPDAVPAAIDACEADVVNLHWVGNGFLTPEGIARIRAAVVWTLHDSYAFTGGCHVPGGCTRFEARCGACPVLGSRHEHDLSRLGWWRKSRAWRGASIAVVTPSRWMADRARRSSLFATRRIEVLPNGVDTRIFRPRAAGEVRARLGAAANERLVLFSAMGGAADPNKGFALLAAALRALAGRGQATGLRLVVAGASSIPDAAACGVPVHCAGLVDDEDALAELLAAADVAVVPSLQENYANTALEALACGTPVAAFRAGGLPEIVVDRQNGALAAAYEVEELASAIHWILAKPERHRALRAAARDGAVRLHAIEHAAARYRTLYEELAVRGARPFSAAE